MFSLRSLLVIAPLAALAYAQKVAFTSLPAAIAAGDQFNITWAGGDGSPVTLTLRRGSPDNLDTVSTIASNVDGYWYNWNVPQTLTTGSDYALQITQGQSDINWTGLFSVTGATTNNTTTTASGASSTTRAGNSTMSVTSMIGSAASAGTGTAMQRNSTFSSASLTSSSSDNSPFTFGSSTTSRSTSSRTASASASATSAPSNDASAMAGSSAALIMGLVAAMMLH